MAIIEYAAKVTSRKQTTIPSAVYKALKLTSADRIVFKVREDGSVILSKAEVEQTDPAVAAYLQLLEKDLINNPQKLSVLQRDEALAKKLANVETDIEL